MTSIGERIISVRGRQTQAVFAERIDISTNTLRSYEKGRALPNQAVLKNICDQFPVSPAWLLQGEGPKEREAADQSRQGPNMGLLAAVLETLEETLDELGKELKPGPKARLVCLLYEGFCKGDAEVKKPAVILRLIRGALAENG